MRKIFLFTLVYVLVLSIGHAKTTQNAGKPFRTEKMNKAITAKASLTTYRPQSMIFETWLTWGNKWRNSDKLIYYYGPGQYLTSDVDQGWDTLSGAWSNNTSDSFGYDNIYRPFIHIVKAWSNSSFMDVSEIIDSFNGNIKTETIYSYNPSGFLPQYRDVYFLDANNNDTLDINQGWSGSGWVNSNKYLSTYNAGGKLASIITYQWGGTAWHLTDREQNYYDSNGNDTLYVHQTAGASPGSWVYVFLQESKNTYNSLSQLVQTIQNGSYDNIKWMPFVKYDYAYNTDGNDTQYIVQSWDSIGKGWINTGRYTMVYNAYTGLKTAHSSQDIKVYPNPAIDRLNVEYYLAEPDYFSFRILDLSGKEIIMPIVGFESAGKHIISLNTSSLSPGMYIYLIQSVAYTFKGKLVIE